MKTILKFFTELFSSSYGKYTLYKVEDINIPITKQIPDPDVDEHSDSMDFISVPTGDYRMIRKQTWVAYHKKTGLPKYKTRQVEL